MSHTSPTCRPTLEPTALPFECVSVGSFTESRASGSRNVITHFRVAPTLRISGVTPPLQQCIHGVQSDCFTFDSQHDVLEQDYSTRCHVTSIKLAWAQQVYVRIAHTGWICSDAISLATEFFYNKALYDESSPSSKLTAIFARDSSSFKFGVTNYSPVSSVYHIL